MKSQLTRKDPIVGKDGGQEKKGVTEDEMVGWHHGLNEHDSEQIPETVMDRKPSVLHSMGSQRVRHN